MSRSNSASAIAPLARATLSSSGTPAAAQRSGSRVHSSGRNSRSPTGAGTSPPASVSETSAWQLARLPSWPQYCRATPTESVPFFGRAVSSITNTASGPPTRRSACSASTRPRPPPPPAALLGQPPPQRRVVPSRAGDEVLQLVMARQTQARRHRLQALGPPPAQPAAQVQRCPEPPLLVPERREKRLQPAIQIASDAAQSCHLHLSPPPAARKGGRPNLLGSAQVVLSSAPAGRDRQGKWRLGGRKRSAD